MLKSFPMRWVRSAGGRCLAPARHRRARPESGPSGRRSKLLVGMTPTVFKLPISGNKPCQQLGGVPQK